MGCNCSGRPTYPTDIEPLLKDVSKKSEWGQLIATNMEEACRLFHERFQEYLEHNVTYNEENIKLIAKKQSNDIELRYRQMFTDIWCKYDEDNLNCINRQQCNRMTLDLLMEQKKFLPRILDALVKEVLIHTKQALDKVENEAGVGKDFVISLYNNIEEAAINAVNEMNEDMNIMIENHSIISERIWNSLARNENNNQLQIQKKDFLSRYQEFGSNGLIDARTIVQKLGLVLEPEQIIIYDESKQLFQHTLNEISSKGLWAQLLCTHLQRVYKIFYRQFFIEMQETTWNVDPIVIKKKLKKESDEMSKISKEVYEDIFFEYDHNRDGRLDTHEFRILIMDMLVAQRSHLPKLTQALISDMLEMARVDAKRGIGDFPLQVPDGWANWYVEAISDRAFNALDEMNHSINEMIRNSKYMADEILNKLSSDNMCKKQEFVENFGHVALPIKLLDPERFAHYLQYG